MQEKAETWVLYLMTVRKGHDGIRAVCKQSEWDAMELARPGYHQLIRTSIPTEAEAEHLARGDAIPPTARVTLHRTWK